MRLAQKAGASMGPQIPPQKECRFDSDRPHQHHRSLRDVRLFIIYRAPDCDGNLESLQMDAPPERHGPKHHHIPPMTLAVGATRVPRHVTRRCGRRLVGPPGLIPSCFSRQPPSPPRGFRPGCQIGRQVDLSPVRKFDKARANTTAETFDHETGPDRKPVW